MQNKQTYSDFWLRGNFDAQTGSLNAMQLASIKRAVGNFVKIVTEMDVPIRYAESGDSYTDGKSVTISTDATKPTEFDPVVGLALHEGSHIKLTDFTLLKQLNSTPEQFFPNSYLSKLMKKHTLTKEQARKYITHYLHAITNVIEDRRIDYYVFTTAPGYFGYYEALYNKYFNSEAIDAQLIAHSVTGETWEAYLFHIINMTNRNRDLNACKEWKKIWQMIDLRNISRLENTKQVYELGVEIFKLIEAQVPAMDPSQDKDNQDWSKQLQQMLSDLLKDASPEVMEALGKAIQSQKDFNDGKISKEALDAETAEAVKALEDAGVELADTGNDTPSGSTGNTTSGKGKAAKPSGPGGGDVRGVETYVVKDFSRKLIDSGVFSWLHYNSSTDKYVKDGIQLGTMLGNKLQIRNEARTTVNTRQESGKLDRRLVNTLGYGNENVCYTMTTEQYNAANIHISIDASGSMSGSKWANTITAVVAICKATSNIKNVRTVVDFRYACDGDRVTVIVAYDSKKHKFNQVQTLFPYLNATGGTPESLCFEAIRKVMNTTKTVKGVDNYFINFSDGAPCFSNQNVNYYDDFAIGHCQREMDMIRKAGWQVLSYFIGVESHDYGIFQRMYGKDARNVDVTQLLPLAKTMNDMLKTKAA